MHDFTAMCYRAYREENILYKVYSKCILRNVSEHLGQIRIMWRTFKNTDIEAPPQRFGFRKPEMGTGDIAIKQVLQAIGLHSDHISPFQNSSLESIVRTAL